jgi:hypothetical protein
MLAYEEEEGCCAHLPNIVFYFLLQVTKKDKWRWNLNHFEGYSVKGIHILS